MRPLEWVMLSVWKLVLRAFWWYLRHKLALHVHGDLDVESFQKYIPPPPTSSERAMVLDCCCCCC